MSSLLPSSQTSLNSSPVRLSGVEEFASQQLGSLQVGQYMAHVSATVGILLQAVAQPTNLVAKPALLLQIPPAPSKPVVDAVAVDRAVRAIQAHQSIEVIGSPGVEKSAFIRQLAHHPAVMTSHSDGILYLTAISPIADIISTLGEQFYHLYPDSYLSVTEWQTALQDCQALVLIDVPAPNPEELRQLRALLPQSTLVWTVEQPCLTVSSLTPSSLTPSSLTPSDSTTTIDDAIAQSITPITLVADSGLQPMSAQESRMAQQLAALDTPQRWILALLTALGGTALSISQIAAITGPQSPQASLQRLTQLGLVQGLAPRYQVVSAWQPWLAQQFESEPWMERSLTVMQTWVQAQAIGAIVVELPLLMRLLQWAAQANRSQDVLTLARSLDPALTLSKQWEQWGQALQWALQAAWQLEDKAAEAWAWHQLGTRSLLLEDLTTAYDALQQSLKLRQAQVQSEPATAADRLALQVTQNNRHYLLQNTLPIAQKQELQAARSWQRTQMSLLILSFVTFCAALSVGLLVKQWLTHGSSTRSAESTGVLRP
jgi:hypothetical protein